MTELKAQHITKEVFDSWQQGKLNDSQETELLTHTGKCTYCAEKFADWMEADLMEPPAYLKEEISRRTRQLDIQTAVKVKQTSKQLQLILYSLKAGLAVAASIFVLSLTSGIQNSEVEMPARSDRTESITDKLNKGSNLVTDALNQITDGVFQPVRESKED